MPAYLLLLVAILTRLLPHSGWLNFTAVGGALLFFGARRSWREMAIPVTALMATDFFLTTYVYHYSFHWQDYLSTWLWYAMAIVLGQILLHAKTTWMRATAGVVLGPTSFFLVSNYAVWISASNNGGMYPHTFAGLIECYIAAIPFYRNDLISTAIVAGLVFGVPALVKKMHPAEPLLAEIRK